MTPHQTLAVAVRLFATWLFAYSLNVILGSYAKLSGVEVAVFGALTFLIAAGLWRFPLLVARSILPAAEPPSAGALTGTPEHWLSMGCALIGLWLLGSAIPRAVFTLEVLTLSDYDSPPRSLTTLWVNSWILQLLLGLWFFFGSRGIARIYHWAQVAGRKTPADGTP